MTPELAPPDRSALTELSGAAWELGRLAVGWRGLGALPGGSGPVMVLPGFMTSDVVTVPLRAALGRLGWEVRGWGLGRNHGDLDVLIPRAVEQVAAWAELAGPVRLVGWSLGGVIAREVAREQPALVERIVTLGTPVVGGPKYTAAAPIYLRRGVDLDALEARIARRNADPVPVPVTALYTRRDGVVAWGACLDPSGGATHVEVEGVHCGLAFRPEVLAVVAEALAS